MLENDAPQWREPSANTPPPDEGGLRAPPDLSLLGKVWWWFHFLILVKIARLRFIGILVLIGVVIVKWDTILAYYDKWTRPEEKAHAASLDVEYFCPMHPTVIRDNPKEKCPNCFMPLSKRKKLEAKDEALPPGIVNRVQFSPYRVVLAGIQTSTVEYLPLSKEITTVGFVDFNEREMKQVTARVKGRLDQLFVNQTGEMVEAGDKLASLYSPDLVVTVHNLLDAKRSNNAELQRLSGDRLQLWGISDDQIKEVLATGKANTHLIIRTPIDGHILKKYVKEGQYVDEGSPLYDVVDLSTVWIQAQVYEEDMAFLPVYHRPLTIAEAKKQGLPIAATTRAFPGQTFEGWLTFVFPHIDQESRTVMVRLELDNPGHKLRPGSSANVKLKIAPNKLAILKKTVTEDWMKATAADNAFHALLSPIGPAAGLQPLIQAAGQLALLRQGLVLSVPEDAVIDTGSLKLVYREVVPGVPGAYEGVKVELGPRMVGPKEVPYYPVLRGLQPGDQIVTAGSFLVDAATRLNPAAGSIYFAGSGGKEGPSGVSSVRPSTPEDEEAKVKAAFGKLSDEDRRLAEQQYWCPVMKLKKEDSRLGLMGTPVKVIVEEQPVYLCCESCRRDAFANPKGTLAEVEKLKKAKAGPSPK